MDFIDLDEHIEHMTGRTVPEIYSEHGDEEFRNIEWRALKDIIQQDNVVVSTGGGVPCHCDNMNLMEKYGEVIYLRLDNDTLVNRLEKATADRPIVKNKTRGELYRYIEDLKHQCEHHYLRAKFIVEGKDLTVDNLIRLLSA